MNAEDAADDRTRTGATTGPNAATADERVWRRFAVTFLSVFFGGLGLIYAALVAIDPYDTGRFLTFIRPGIAHDSKRMGDASRGRDPQFDVPILGNLRNEQLDPERLSVATGMSFVQLTTPGSGPSEHMTMMRYFMRHHPRIAAIVLNVDERWCVHDPSLPEGYPFPFWLYRGNLEYLANLLRTRAIMYARKRVDFALGLTPPTDPRGYFDYEIGPPRYFHPADPPADAVMPGAGLAPDTYFPAIDEFDRVLATLPAEMPLIIVVPPVYQSFLLSLAPQVAADLPACKAALARRVANRPRSGFLDFMVDGPISRDSANFIDPDHYRRNIARIIEASIVAVLGAGKPTNEAIAK
jgi:hypothetical protein